MRRDIIPKFYFYLTAFYGPYKTNQFFNSQPFFKKSRLPFNDENPIPLYAFNLFQTSLHKLDGLKVKFCPRDFNLVGRDNV